MISNEKIIDFIFEEIYAKRNLNKVNEAFDDEAIMYGSMGEIKGVEAIKNVYRTWLSAFPDLRYEADEIILKDDKVVCRWHGFGTHKSVFLGISPTHRKIKHEGMEIIHMKNGKIKSLWANSNMFEIFKMLSQ